MAMDAKKLREIDAEPSNWSLERVYEGGGIDTGRGQIRYIPTDKIAVILPYEKAYDTWAELVKKD